MRRNLTLLGLSAAVLTGLYLGYLALIGPGPSGTPSDSAPAEWTRSGQESGASPPLQVGDITIPPGETISFTRYDERTGLPTDRFRCEDWRPVPDARNEILATRPELMMRLPSGLIALVSADEGRLTLDRENRRRARPKLGWLRGSARIVIQRQGDIPPIVVEGKDEPETSTAPAAPSEAPRPEVLLTLATERLDFDLELGELHAEGPLRVEGREFEISGTGLHLVFSQASNELERLTVVSGEQLVLWMPEPAASQPALDSDRGADGPSAIPGPQGAAPARGIATAAGRRDQRPRNAYRCVLEQEVHAEHRRGDELLGQMRCDRLALLVDVGSEESLSGGGRGPRREAVRSADGERLIVRWAGPLHIRPEPAPTRSGAARRHLEAHGAPVELRAGESLMHCSRLLYHVESGLLWCYPTASGRVSFQLAPRLRGSARSVVADLSGGLVKLVGDVLLESPPGPDGRGQAVTLRCQQWAELHLAAGAAAGGEMPAGGPLLEIGALRSASLVGSVRVDWPDQRLVSHRLDVKFRRQDEAPAAGLGRGESPATPRGGGPGTAAGPRARAGESDDLGKLLDSATASGEVRFVAGPQSLDCDRLDIDFAVDETGQSYARTLVASGQVLLRDRRQAVAARGQRVTAHLQAAQQLSRAVVESRAAGRALVYVRPYLVRAARIEVDPQGESLHVPGAAVIRFHTRRGLQGVPRARPARVEVSCSEQLRVDGKQNRIELSGQVLARSGRESLAAQAATILLEDVPEGQARSREADIGLLDLLPGAARWIARVGGGMAGLGQRWTVVAAGADERRRRGGALHLPRARADRDAGQPMRKEPILILARHAVLQSESPHAADEDPLVHSSIAAPEMQIDLRQRRLHTTGETSLLMTDRRLGPEDQGSGGVLGIPSALVTRGASQTALLCQQSMDYVLGPEGPDRRDSVVFEGQVQFRHVAGREMYKFEEMLPQVRDNPELLSRLRSRNTFLQCARLEAEFVRRLPEVDAPRGPDRPAPSSGARAAADEQAAPGADATLTPVRLSWLAARGDVYLRDQQGAGVREVEAQAIEFDRGQRLVRVFGDERRPARVWYQNPQTGQLDRPATAREIVIDLLSDTLRTTRLEGEMRRR